MAANPPVLYEPQSPNLAPLKPLVQIVQQGNLKAESTLQGALKELFRHHIGLEKKVWEEMYLAGYEVANFIEGRQFLRPNPWSPGTYLSYSPKLQNEATKRTLNLMRFYTTNALWKWQLSNPDIVAIAGIDTEQSREAAKAADAIVEHYERKFFTPTITIKEAMHGLCWGTYIWRIRYDDSIPGVKVSQPVYGEQQATLGEGYGQCGDCGLEATAQDFIPNEDGTFSCPECGGEAMVESAQESIPSVVGEQEIQLGDICAELLPFPECRWNINTRAEDSSWFIHQRRTSATAIRRLLGNVKLPSATGSDDFGLDIIEKLAWAGQSGGGQARAENKKVKLHEEPVTVVEYSLGPDDIADIVLKEPEQSVDGQTIPAGPLIATFPDGLTVQGINGLNLITGIYAEHHNKSIVQGVWHSRTTSGVGQGFSDVVEVQKRFNADDSQIHTFLRATGTPAMMFRQEALGDEDRADYIGDPRINIPINMQNIPEGVKLEDVIRPAFQPQSVPSQLFSYVYQKLNDFAQLTSHITDFSGGLPNVNNRTATGAQISQANSNALFTPPLQVKGEVRQKIAKIVVDLYREHFPVTRPFPLKGRFGRLQYLYLNGANISTDISFEVVKDSELPKNQFTKRDDLLAFFGMLQGPQGYAELQAMNPELLLEMERAFNIQMNSETYDQVSSLCQQRLQQMKDIAPLVPIPEMLVMAIQPPIELVEPSHELKAKWWSEWLDEDEGQMSDPALRQAAVILVQQHFEMYTMVQAAMAAVSAIANPQPEGEPGEEGGGEGGGPPAKESGGSAKKSPDVHKKPNTDPRRKITGRPESKGGGKK